MLVVMAYTYNHNTWEAEVRGPQWKEDSSGIQVKLNVRRASEDPFSKKKTKKKKEKKKKRKEKNLGAGVCSIRGPEFSSQQPHGGS